MTGGRNIVRIRWAVCALLGICLVACGGDDTAASTTTEAPVTTTLAVETTSTSEATTTTSVRPTTTTTVAAVDAASVAEVFRSYFDAVVAKDYEAARGLSSGSAAEYASFTEQLDLISSQPDWQLESEPAPVAGDAVGLDDGRYGAETSLAYADPNRDARLEVSNPAVQVTDDAMTLDEWGLGLGGDAEAPSLSQRIKLLGFTAVPDPSSCFDSGMWAYVPGGTDTDEQVRIIGIGLACSPDGGLVPLVSDSRIYSEDGAVDAPPTTFLLQGGGDMVPANTPTYYLAIFDLPRSAVAANLIWETPFERTNVPATTIHAWEVGLFDLD